MDSEKMADEKFEHRKGSAVEEGFGDVDESVAKKVLWKMDVRYVSIPVAAAVTMLIVSGYCLSLRSSFCAPSSTVRMLAMQRSWVSKPTSTSPIISMLSDCVSSMRLISLGMSSYSIQGNDQS